MSKDSLYKKFSDRFNFENENKLIETLKATAFKVNGGVVTDEQMATLLIVADQYNLNPFTREIFAFPDRKNGIIPVVSVDGWSRIINEHPDMDGLKFVYSDEWVTPNGAKPCPTFIECVIYRKNRTHPVSIKEFIDETYREPYTAHGSNGPYVVTGPWQTHTKRFLRHKALIQCSRIAFGFVGIYDQDEAELISEGVIDVKPEDTSTQEASIKAQTMLPKLIERADKSGAWNAALDYVKEYFNGYDAVFVSNEIIKARELKEKSLTN